VKRRNNQLFKMLKTQWNHNQTPKFIYPPPINHHLKTLFLTLKNREKKKTPKNLKIKVKNYFLNWRLRIICRSILLKNNRLQLNKQKNKKKMKKIYKEQFREDRLKTFYLKMQNDRFKRKKYKLLKNWRNEIKRHNY